MPASPKQSGTYSSGHSVLDGLFTAVLVALCLICAFILGSVAVKSTKSENIVKAEPSPNSQSVPVYSVDSRRIWVDPDTGCQYFTSARGIQSVRYDKSGKPFCIDKTN